MTHKKVPKRWGIFIAILFSVSIFSSLLINITLVYGIAFTLAVALTILKLNGILFKESLSWIIEGLLSIKTIFILVILIGINVAMWISSGVVPGLIFYGFAIVDKVYFILFAYLMSALVAFFLGTGLGTLSTMGVALFTLGVSIGMPKGILVGALMSGAYVADRLSPISALVNFTTETIQIKFKPYFKKTIMVMLPAAILAGITYYFLSLKYQSILSVEEMMAYKEAILNNFVISPWLFIIPVVVLWLSFRGVRAVYVLGIGIALSAGVTLLIQNQSIGSILNFMIWGFKTTNPSAFIQSLEIGGAYAMVEVIFIIMAGLSLSTLYDKCGWISPFINFMTLHSKSALQTVLNTGLLSTGLNALTCDQTGGILIPGRYLKPLFKKYNMDENTLAQVIANTGTALAPLMPWNVNAIIVFAITGVSALEYAPFTFLNLYSFPLAVILTGWVYRHIKS